MAKIAREQTVWIKDKVELLPRDTSKHKASKLHDEVDWESSHLVFADILVILGFLAR